MNRRAPNASPAHQSLTDALRLLRGESLEMVSREVGVELYRLEAWQARALAGLEPDMRAERGSWSVYPVVLETAWRVAIHRHVAGR